MGGRTRPSEHPKPWSSLEREKRYGYAPYVVPDEAVSKCTGCGSDFSAFNRRGRTPLTTEENAQAVRVCDRCMAHVTERLSRAKDAASRPVSLQSHEDLAKKLQLQSQKAVVQVPSSGSETIECGVCQHPFLVSAH
ncbi:Protein FREE1 [Bienertia sinuspersici]